MLVADRYRDIGARRSGHFYIDGVEVHAREHRAEPVFPGPKNRRQRHLGEVVVHAVCPSQRIERVGRTCRRHQNQQRALLQVICGQRECTLGRLSALLERDGHNRYVDSRSIGRRNLLHKKRFRVDGVNIGGLDKVPKVFGIRPWPTQIPTQPTGCQGPQPRSIETARQPQPERLDVNHRSIAYPRQRTARRTDDQMPFGQLDTVHAPLGSILGTRQLTRTFGMHRHQKFGVGGQIMRGFGISHNHARTPVGLTEQKRQPEHEDGDDCAQRCPPFWPHPRRLAERPGFSWRPPSHSPHLLVHFPAQRGGRDSPGVLAAQTPG